jgi:hypothetical protein
LAVTALAVVAAVAPASASAAAAKKPPLPVGCTNAMGAPAGCTAELVGFQGWGGQLRAVVKVTKTATGQSVTFTRPIPSPSNGLAARQAAASTCTILDLTIPPIDLFLLGIRIQTDTIHLVITAERGTLLGNLLCGLFFPLSAQSAGVQAFFLNALLQQGGVSTA